MKKKLLSSLLVLGTTAGAFAPATILATDVLAEPTADITINGSLGLDNTDPDEEIEEGDTNWVNVTLDTATIFYNHRNTAEIASPTYNIVNNSGRPVSVSIQNFANTGGDFSEISSLTINSPEFSVSEDLITNGELHAFTEVTNLFTLANSEGSLAANGGITGPNAATFNYSGTVSSNTVARANPAFTLTLQLDALKF